MSIHTKKVLYISLIKSTLTYCSPIWRPQYLKDIQAIENVQRRATKFILHDYASSYKSRLFTLHLLPLMMQLEINDILFFITSIKNPTKRFNILHYVTFSTASTRWSSKCKLVHNLSRTNRVHWTVSCQCQPETGQPGDGTLEKHKRGPAKKEEGAQGWGSERLGA